MCKTLPWRQHPPCIDVYPGTALDVNGILQIMASISLLLPSAASGRRNTPLQMNAANTPLRRPADSTRAIRPIVLFALASGIAGCPPRDQLIEADLQSGRERAVPQCRVIGHSVEGRPIECEIFGEGPDVILIMASIHGDEPVGTPLLDQLSAHLRHRPDLLVGRRIILVPVANPDGYAKYLRHNVRDVDLNRNFPAGNYLESGRHGESPLSEPESQAIYRVLHEHLPKRIVSIHQPRKLPPCIDYDGPADGLAREMASHTDLPVIKLGSRPGSLGAYAGDTMNTPIITLEIPRSREDRDSLTLWRRYGRMMIAAIEYAGGN